MKNSSSGHGDLSDDEFIRLFTPTQRPLFLYILPLIGNVPDTDEVLQETNLVLWAKRSQFRPGTSFLAWARAIARFEVFRFRRSRPAKLKFLTGELLEMMAATTEHFNSETELERRQEALTDCLKLLREKDRALIRMRYSPGVTGDDVARQLGRPPNSVYQSLGRIRRALAECIQRRLAVGGVA